jgi:hypothetical protein
VTELFESNLTFIVLALIVGVRFVLYLRRKAAEKQERERREGPPPPLSGIAALEAEGAAVLKATDGDEEFSAWALDVDREPAPPPPVPVLPVAVRTLVAHPVQEIAPPVEAPPPPEAAYVLAGPVVKTGSAFWGKLKTLSPLRQGVILSEILGPPKGL